MVRSATFDDIPAIVGLLRVMHAESRFRSIEFVDAKAAATVAGLLTERMCVLVAEREGAMIGFFLGAVSEYFFSHEPFAADLALFVDPSQRGGMAGASLLRAFKAWAQARGIRHVEIGVTTGVTVEKTAALFERLGFRRQGITFAMEAT